jgi:hypothetical protein
MACGHMNRVKRPDTWLHRPILQNVKKVLANPEPSTHDPEQPLKPISDIVSAAAGTTWRLVEKIRRWPVESFCLASLPLARNDGRGHQK